MSVKISLTGALNSGIFSLLNFLVLLYFKSGVRRGSLWKRLALTKVVCGKTTNVVKEFHFELERLPFESVKRKRRRSGPCLPDQKATGKV